MTLLESCLRTRRDSPRATITDASAAGSYGPTSNCHHRDHPGRRQNWMEPSVEAARTAFGRVDSAVENGDRCLLVKTPAQRPSN